MPGRGGANERIAMPELKVHAALLSGLLVSFTVCFGLVLASMLCVYVFETSLMGWILLVSPAWDNSDFWLAPLRGLALLDGLASLFGAPA